MNKRNKKGFTIVELVIVIAVIGVLSAILIPTFSSLIKSAREAADTHMVKNLNTALETDSITNGKHETAYDAIQAANKSGYSVEKLTPTSLGYSVVWDKPNDRFILIDDKGDYKFFDQATEPSENESDLWKIYNLENILMEDGTINTNEEYSIYLANTKENVSITVNAVCFDAGENTGLTKVTYNGSSNGIDAIIRTNGGALEVNAEKDTVNHYGSIKTLSVNAVKEYNEYSHVGKLETTGTVKLIAHSGARFCQSREEIVALVGSNSELDSAEFNAHNYENNSCLICGNADEEFIN